MIALVGIPTSSTLNCTGTAAPHKPHPGPSCPAPGPRTRTQTRRARLASMRALATRVVTGSERCQCGAPVAPAGQRRVRPGNCRKVPVPQ
eukprot:2869939-Rhodomonas_salina.1